MSSQLPETTLIARLETSFGSLVLRLFEDEAPEAVRHFIALALGRGTDPHEAEFLRATNPVLEGALFQRVFPDFMIQCAAPSRESDISAHGHSGESAHLAATGASVSLPFDRPGRVAFASEVGRRLGAQFFITEVPTPHLDGRHVVFGEVVRGFELVPKIARVRATASGFAFEPVVLEHIAIDRVTST